MTKKVVHPELKAKLDEAENLLAVFWFRYRLQLGCTDDNLGLKLDRFVSLLKEDGSDSANWESIKGNWTKALNDKTIHWTNLIRGLHVLDVPGCVLSLTLIKGDESMTTHIPIASVSDAIKHKRIQKDFKFEYDIASASTLREIYNEAYELFMGTGKDADAKFMEHLKEYAEKQRQEAIDRGDEKVKEVGPICAGIKKNLSKHNLTFNSLMTFIKIAKLDRITIYVAGVHPNGIENKKLGMRINARVTGEAGDYDA